MYGAHGFVCVSLFRMRKQAGIVVPTICALPTASRRMAFRQSEAICVGGGQGERELAPSGAGAGAASVAADAPTEKLIVPGLSSAARACPVLPSASAAASRAPCAVRLTAGAAAIRRCTAPPCRATRRLQRLFFQPNMLPSLLAPGARSPKLSRT